MTWRDELYLASFRGVAFEVRDTRGVFGRRKDVAEYPGGDEPTVEDLGRKAHVWTLQAFVIGDDYLEQKRRLIEACNNAKDGGTLVLPHYGPLPVENTVCECTETNAAGGFAAFNLEFVRVPGKPPAYAARASLTAIDTAADAVADQGEAATAEGLAAANVPEFVRAASASKLQEFAATLRAADAFRGATDAAAELAADLDLLIGTAAQVVTSPAEAAASIKVSLERVLAAAGNGLGAFNAYRVLFELQATELGSETSLGAAADNNAKLIAQQARRAAFAGAARALVRVQWSSYDDAVSARAQLLEPLDLELETAELEGYGALLELRAQLVLAVPGQTRDLPRLVRFTLPRRTSVVELAYQLFDDVERAREIHDRNRFSHPGRIGADELIEVLSA